MRVHFLHVPSERSVPLEMSPSSQLSPNPTITPSAMNGHTANAPSELRIPSTSTSSNNERLACPLNVVVTGGSSGIGAAIVHTFAQSGHRVLFTYLTGRPRALKLQASHPSTTAVLLDQADVQSVALFATTVDRWAGTTGVHVLINNAALGSATVERYVNSCASETLSPSSISPASSPSHVSSSVSPSIAAVLERAAKDEALVKVNALGPLWVTDAIMDVLHRAAYASPISRASIIFISSVGGGSQAVFPEYCTADLMSKAAMTYHSKHMAAKYAREPVDIVCLAPGATETEMFRESTLSKVSDPAVFINSMPKRRLIQPDEIARTVFWLATSCPSGLFHGAVLDASMGLAVRPGLQTETEGSR